MELETLAKQILIELKVPVMDSNPHGKEKLITEQISEFEKTIKKYSAEHELSIEQTDQLCHILYNILSEKPYYQKRLAEKVLNCDYR